MTIDEAIKILDDQMGLGERYDDDELDEANQLGIEALKFIKALRGNEVISSNIRLHGETKE